MPTFFNPTPEEMKSFNSVLRHTLLEGPLRLVRFTDSTRGHQASFGPVDPKCGLHRSYWMYCSELEEILETSAVDGPYGLRLIREVSQRWAISDDWGDLGRTYVMNIPTNGALHAYFGFAKFQPKISQATQNRTGRTTVNSYPGGSLQIVTRIGENEKNWIKGPLRTRDLSAKKLRGL